ncbi:PLP-dependent aminotransferase family protein [Calorimonas adulescens]|uniref:PLP-dependent aminotransferase family protein n=1 Tax=Calorimonas adulescens TaxID=2606906 RepID=A0A5D8QH71_9THEO|nr:PLP-dependent aminotransferase family protein [Calorimonas adulescens]TZE83599.1 PLP-dependent aminotransferase family protein [Calorimonas adulescens]
MGIENLIKIDKKREEPLYMQIYIQIKDMVEKGIIKEGTKLPTIRRLSKLLGVNTVTVVNAYHMLEKKGIAYSIVGSGTYIGAVNYKFDLSGDVEPEIVDSISRPIGSRYINFASSNPSHELFPVREFKEIFAEVLDRDGGMAFTYQESMGYRPLRESLSRLLAKDGISTDPRKILIISGAQQGLDIISKVLVGQGDNILVERPTYTGAIAVFKSRNANIIDIPVTNEGIDIKRLEEILRKHNIKLFYLMPMFQNPTGVRYSDEIKSRIMKLSREYGFFIVEDDFVSDIYYDSRPTPIWDYSHADNVIFIKSFSKVFMPGLRLAFMVLPDMLLESIQAAKYSSDIATSGFFQRSLQLFLDKGLWDKHTEMLRHVYKARRDFMAECLNNIKNTGITFKIPDGGLNFWLTLPISLNDREIYEAALKEKVIVAPGSFFYLNNPEHNHLRLGFASTNEDEIEGGINIIRDILLALRNENYIQTEPLL